MTFISSLIDFSDPQDSAAPRLRHAFGAPRSVLVAHELAQVGPLLDAVQAAAQQGFWCVGYLRYEAAAAFDAAFSTHAPDGPLAGPDRPGLFVRLFFVRHRHFPLLRHVEP